MEIRTYMFEPTCLETKVDSYNQIDTKQRQSQVLEVLGDEILTAKEIAIRMYEKGYTNNDDRNNASPRLNELVNLGLVVIYGKKKCEFSGKTVAVFKKVKSEENDYKEKYENLKVTYDNLKVTYENIKNIEAFTRVKITELKKENEKLRKELKKRYE